MTNQLIKSDIAGSVTSLLCLIHCIATPFVVLALSSEVYHSGLLFSFWKSLDAVFITASLLAISFSIRKSTKKWIKLGLLTSWVFMLMLVFNEKAALFELAEEMIYIPSLSLIFFHIFNLKSCACKEAACCVS